MGRAGSLGKWTHEQHEFYVSERISGHSIRYSHKLLLETFPDCHEYTISAIQHHDRIPPVRTKIIEGRRALDSQPCDAPYSDKNERVRALAAQAEQMLEKREELLDGGKVPDLVRVAQEFRATLKAISEELGIQKGEAVPSWLQEFLEASESMKAPREKSN